MKPTTKIICCIATLSWISSTTAAAAYQRVPVPVHYVTEHDQVKVETKLNSDASQAKKRSDQAKKNATDRAKKRKP